jgi:serpin B
MRARLPALLVVAVMVASCGTPGATPGSATPSAPTAYPSATPTSSPSPQPLAIGSVAVTVSDGLQVRSEPRVSDDSIKYEPVLPIGTTLTVLDGPVPGSGYTWYKVAPLTFGGLNGPGYGWVAIAGKDGEPWVGPAEGPLAQLALAFSAIERATADPAAAKAVAAAVNAFGVDLYGTFAGDENLVFSPASIALAFGMVQAGARGATAAEIYDVFHTPGWDAFGSGLNALDQALTSRNATWMDYTDEPTKSLILRIANSAFAQSGWEMEQPYLDAIASAFGAGVRLVDYMADPEAARLTINRWVSDRTEDRIPELLMPDNVSTLTRLYLVNAVYLKGEWLWKFHQESTESRPFTRTDGTTVAIATMHQQEPLPYAAGPGWQATQLDIRGGPESAPLALTFILPDDIAAFEEGLTANQLDAIVATLERERGRAGEEIDCEPTDGDSCGCHRYDVDLYLPKFGVDTRRELKRALGALGMRLAFSLEDADFTGIHVPTDPSDAIYISAVVHQANIDVDEQGCEAAAATAIGFDTGGCTGTSPIEVHTVRLDRPFLFVLRDIETGAILFMGRVVDPSITD